MTDLLIRRPLAVMTGAPGAAARAGTVDLRLRAGYIAEMEPALTPLPGERVIDASNCVVYPGWINTHHHLFQSLLKGVPGGLNHTLFEWLGSVPYAHIERVDADLLRLAATIGLAELLLSGTTTCADHHYVYHPGLGQEEAELLFEVAETLGIRFALCRGGATLHGNHPGYPRRLVPESADAIAADVARLAARHHEPGGDAMKRVVMAPTTPTFSVAPADLRDLAAEGRRLGLRLHSHLSETAEYVSYCREVHNMTPVAFCAAHDWLGPDVWFAHLVHVTADEIAALAESGTGIAHCPQSNARLGSGIAPVPAMAAAGMPVSIGVDGAASNEAADMISELRMAWLVHRAKTGPRATQVEEVIHWGSASGAAILGLDRVGTLAPGMAADLVLYDLDHPRYFGLHDPALAPLLAGGAPHIRLALVQGRIVVEDGRIPGLDLTDLGQHAREAVARLA